MDKFLHCHVSIVVNPLPLIQVKYCSHTQSQSYQELNLSSFPNHQKTKSRTVFSELLLPLIAKHILPSHTKLHQEQQGLTIEFYRFHPLNSIFYQQFDNKYNHVLPSYPSPARHTS